MRRIFFLISILYIIAFIILACKPLIDKSGGEDNDDYNFGDEIGDGGNPHIESLILDDFEEKQGDFSGKLQWYIDSTHQSPPTIQSETKYLGNNAVVFDNHGQGNSSSFMEVDIIAEESTYLYFYYKVSSEKGYDHLKFYINGSRREIWSGNINWSMYKLYLDKGEYTLRWEYNKDINIDGFEDKAWIDHIFSDKPLQFLAVKYHLNVEVEGTGTVDIIPKKHFYIKGEKINLIAHENDNHVFFRWVGNELIYGKSIEILMDSDKDIDAIFIDISTLNSWIKEDWETGNFTENAWILGGDNLPFIQTDEVYEGKNALQFGDITDSQTSHLEIPVYIDRDSVVRFYTKIECESGYYDFYDGLKFYVNDMDYPVISWDSDNAMLWTEYKINLEAGFNILRWEYSKNIISSEDRDTAWIDNIEIIDLMPEIDVTQVNNNGIYIENAVLDNDNINIKLNINNTGFSDLILGRITNSNELFYISNNPSHKAIEPGKYKVLNLRLSPTSSTQLMTNIVIPSNDPVINQYKFQIKVNRVKENEGFLFMMYMGGDNNLETALWYDINEMEYGLHLLETKIREKVRVIVLWDGYKGYSSLMPEGGMLYMLAADDKLDLELSEETLSLNNGWFEPGIEIDTGSGKTLEQFIKYNIREFPSYKNKVLIMSGHGKGVKDIHNNRYGLNDQESETALYTNEVQQAIINAMKGRKLSLIGYDACVMANIEEAYEYRDLADYFVASPEDEFGDGWEYHDLLNRIDIATNAEELSREIVNSYRTIVGGNQTLTAVDLRYMNKIKSNLDYLASLLYEHIEVNQLKSIFEKTLVSGNDSMYFGDFINNIISSDFINYKINESSHDVLDEYKKAIAYSWSGPFRAGPYNGVGEVSQEGLVIEKTPHSWYTSEPYQDFGSIDFCNSTDDGKVNTWKELINKILD
jgi:hypothetical protein